MKKKLLNSYILGLIFLSLIIGTSNLFLNPYKAKNSQINLSQLFATARWRLNSQQQYKEVRVPFTQKKGLIYVQAFWAGKPVNCILDTGATYISWPQTLNLKSKPTGKQIQMLGVGGKYRILGEWVLAPNIKLGGFELENLPTILQKTVEKANGQNISIAQAEGVNEIILGNTVFQNIILTIDYQKQEIVLRNKDYDITKNQNLKKNLVNMIWDDENLIILGKLANYPARFQVDTGNTSRLAVNIKFAQKHFANYPRTQSKTELVSGTIYNENMPSIQGNINGIKFETGRLAIIPFNSDVDALVGEPFLRNYRTTIDYKRRKILLEPYSQFFQ
ncbi:aspartyl protease family protein [Aulosira sp. FACHB-615]|uniref:aspartyl protease family protein n=1 Tax=Aulosira sp. FACHB-615 TaxID=2692777 RepID=UPI0016837D7E|nr:aspartyl protease family protein [Aulosira sp. FACHB-615]MBD2492100.1 aspartyl protease family protein [Aulosira sp. FACHB-615]